MAGWYVRRGEKLFGPVDLAKLSEAVASGVILPTDQLATDIGGPWTEARSTVLFPRKMAEPPGQPPPPAVVPKVEYLPIQDQPPSNNKLATIVRTTNVFIGAVGRGTLTVSSAVMRSLATRAQRRHELKLAKIQAQALADSQRPPADANPPVVPIMFAPQIVQTTVVKVVNRNSGGCGCSGCGLILLLILLAVLAVALYSNMHPSSPQYNAQPTPQRFSQLQPQQQSEPTHYQKVGNQGKIQLVWIDPHYKYDPNVYEQAIRELGGNEDFCMIHFWDNRQQVPSKFPMSDEQVESQVAQYERNSKTGHEQFFYMRNGRMAEPFGNRPSTTPMPVTNSNVQRTGSSP